MYRSFKFLIGLILVAAFVLVGEPSQYSSSGFRISEASAQQQKRRSLFSILFGRPDVKRKKVRRKKKRKTVRRKLRRKVVKKRTLRKGKKAAAARSRTRSKAKRRKTAKSVSRVAAPAPAVVKKLENAKKVVVIGDFLAGGLADGLETGLAKNGAIVVVDRAKASSGFVRSDIVNWPEAAVKIIAEEQPSYVVAMLGTNDRQLMRLDGKRINKRTPEWDTAYQSRVAALGASLKQSGVPFTWVGLPPVRFNSMNSDFLVFNEWYRKTALASGGKFVDVWDGFSDADGAYTRSGPDVNGQIVLLRNKDGINLTKAGRRRLGFYVEGDVVQTLGSAIALSSLEDLSGLATAKPSEPQYDPSRSGKTVVISLDDPASDGGDKLAGETINLTQQLGSSAAIPVAARVRSGTQYTNRADNFAWPPASEPVAIQGPVAQVN